MNTSEEREFCKDTGARVSSYFLGSTKIPSDRKARGRNPVHKCTRPPPFAKQLHKFGHDDVDELRDSHRDLVGCNSRSDKCELLATNRRTPFTPITRRYASFSDRRSAFSDRSPPVSDAASTSVCSQKNSQLHENHVHRQQQQQAPISSYPYKGQPPHHVGAIFETPLTELLLKKVARRLARLAQHLSAVTTAAAISRKGKRTTADDEWSQWEVPLSTPSKLDGGFESNADYLAAHQSPKCNEKDAIPSTLNRRNFKATPAAQCEKLQQCGKLKPITKAEASSHLKLDDAIRSLIIGATYEQSSQPQPVFDQISTYDLISNLSHVLKTLRERKYRSDQKTRRRILTKIGVYECPGSRALLAGVSSTTVSEDRFGGVPASDATCKMVSSWSTSSNSDDESWSSNSENASAMPASGAGHQQKHIHPCICDLTKAQRKKIERYLNEKMRLQIRFEKRLEEIEEELQRLADEEEERRQREDLEKEFYGDEYEMVEGRKKRMKRSARRVSMVSLGVKQVINWRREPRIAVKYTKTYRLRRAKPTYCKPKLSIDPMPMPKPIRGLANVSIKHTRTSKLRANFNKVLGEVINRREYRKYPDRPEFVLRIC